MYPFLYKQVLAKIDAERAHRLGFLVIRAVARGPFAWLARLITRPGADLRVRALGLTFASPFGMAAGFDKDAHGILGLGSLGFGHVEVGTVTAIPQPGNPRPRLFRLLADRALINRMGFNNRGAIAASEQIVRVASRRRRPIIGANIGKSRVVEVDEAVDDYLVSARALAPVADYIAVNVSSPNTPGLRGLQELARLRPLLQAVKDAVGTVPLLVKIAPDLTDEQVVTIATLATDLGLAGIIATNTTIGRENLRTRPQAVERIGPGGLSGEPVAARSLEVLTLLRRTVPDQMCIISVGGVETAHDVQERMDAGATLVQGYTGFIYRGPLWARQINRGLARLRRQRQGAASAPQS